MYEERKLLLNDNLSVVFLTAFFISVFYLTDHRRMIVVEGPNVDPTISARFKIIIKFTFHICSKKFTSKTRGDLTLWNNTVCL